MGYLWDFGIDEEGWVAGGGSTAEWTFSDGNNGFGCLMIDIDAAEESETTWTKTLSPTESGYSDLTFYYKAINNGGSDHTLYWSVNYDDATSDSDSINLSTGTTDWTAEEITSLNAAKNVEDIIFTVGPEGESFWGEVYFDDILLGSVIDDLRYLGLDADQENIYLTGIEGGTQKVFYYDQDTLTSQGTSSFGAVDYADPDSLTAGLWPMVKPGADNVIYAYGRDGNSAQIHYNDLNGTLGWQDIGPGTATWGTAKFMGAAMIDPLSADDLVVAFSDDDVYTTPEGTANWVKLGDITEGVRAAARHPVRDNEILFAGTAAGSAYWSPNWGVSDTAAGGTALGTIHWLEVSR